MNRDPKWCRTWSRATRIDRHGVTHAIPEEIRLPVYKVGGSVCANEGDIVAWERRLRVRGINPTARHRPWFALPSRKAPR